MTIVHKLFSAMYILLINTSFQKPHLYSMATIHFSVKNTLYISLSPNEFALTKNQILFQSITMKITSRVLHMVEPSVLAHFKSFSRDENFFVEIVGPFYTKEMKSNFLVFPLFRKSPNQSSHSYWEES